MQHFTIPTSSNPTVTIEIGGDLRLTGSDVDEVSAKGDDNVQVLTNEVGDVEVSSSARGIVTVPRHAHVIVLRVGGDARIEGLQADMEIEHVGGDLRLNEVVSLTINHVGGDLKAREVGGSLKAEHVGGDVLAKSIAGPCELTEVGADVILRDFNASVMAKAGSDIILKDATFHPGQTYELEASGDVICRLASGNSVKFETEVNGDLVVRVPDAGVDQDHGLVVIGTGEALVKATAGADVVISEYQPDDEGVDGLGDFVSSTVASAISGALAGVSRSTGRIDAEQIAAKARRAADRAQQAAEAAQRKAEAYQRKAEKISEKAESRAGRRRTWGFTINVPNPPRPPAPPRPPSMPTRPIVVPTSPRVVNDPVSDEERLSVLRLLEQGKITAAEAEKLLAALEGK